MADDSVEDDEQEPKRTSPIMVIVFMLVATLIAGGAGFGAGHIVFAPMIAANSSEPEMAAAKDDGAAEKKDDGHGATDEADAGGSAKHGLDYGSLIVVELDPITTNIGAPEDVWVRMELSIAATSSEEGEGPPEAMVEAIQADFLAYMRTVRLRSVALPSGYQHLVTDLERMAAMRSEGQVKRVFVKALLLE